MFRQGNDVQIAGLLAKYASLAPKETQQKNSLKDTISTVSGFEINTDDISTDSYGNAFISISPLKKHALLQYKDQILAGVNKKEQMIRGFF